MRRKHHRSAPSNECNVCWRDKTFALHAERRTLAHPLPAATTRPYSGDLASRYVMPTSSPLNTGCATCIEKGACVPAKSGAP